MGGAKLEHGTVPTGVLAKLRGGEGLSFSEAEELMGQIMEERFDIEQIKEILHTLNTHARTPPPSEIRGYIAALRARMRCVALPDQMRDTAVDTCGTGGDGHNTFNISTAAAFVVAGCGVPVVKHGNRSATSKCGSADVLEALDVHILLNEQQAVEVLREAGIVFLFAPAFHPGLKSVAPVRKQLPFPTIFNYLGPFCSPAQVRRQVVGIPDPAMARQMAVAASGLDIIELIIVTGPDRLDEAGLHGPTTVLRVQGGTRTGKRGSSQHEPQAQGRAAGAGSARVSVENIDPTSLGLTSAPLDALRGGGPQENSRILRAVLDGSSGPRRDVVLLNAAIALLASGTVQSLRAGVERAAQSIDSGAAREALARLQNATQRYAGS